MKLSQHKAIREYGYLIKGGDCSCLSAQSLSQVDWDWLFQVNIDNFQDQRSFLKPANRNGRPAMQVANYVGVIELPSGLQLEILPKISEEDTESSSRYWLLKMLTAVENIKPIAFTDTQLQTFKQPLLEILIGRFLADVQHLVNKGLCSEYLREQSEEPFLRGKLRVSVHASLPAYKKSIFPIEYDEYSLKTTENKLIHWAINTVYHWTKNAFHKAHARKLLMMLAGIPASSDPKLDLAAWKNTRLNQHYQPVKPWVELIVSGISPKTQSGRTRGISLLYPMEQVFEKYVYKTLKRQMSAGYSLHAQKRLGWLAEHKQQSWFKLNPDLVIKKDKQITGILDTKWKLIDAALANGTDKYGLSQADFYQMFAYAYKGRPIESDLYLIYPKTTNFSRPLPEFDLDNGYKLHVVPFDLDLDRLLTATPLIPSQL